MRYYIAALITLIIAGVANYLIAWGCIVTWPPGNAVLTEMSEQYDCSRMNRSTLPASVSSFAVLDAECIRYRGPGWTRTSIAWEFGCEDSGELHAVAIMSSGWPFRSLYGWRKHVYDDDGSQTEYGGVMFWPHDWPLPHSLRMGFALGMPWWPLWFGYVANVLVYWCILLIMWKSPLILRRAYRRRHGRCLNCGYDIGHALCRRCPECGVTTTYESAKNA